MGGRPARGACWFKAFLVAPVAAGRGRVDDEPHDIIFLRRSGWLKRHVVIRNRPDLARVSRTMKIDRTKV